MDNEFIEIIKSYGEPIRVNVKDAVDLPTRDPYDDMEPTFPAGVPYGYEKIRDEKYRIKSSLDLLVDYLYILRKRGEQETEKYFLASAEAKLLENALTIHGYRIRKWHKDHEYRV